MISKIVASTQILAEEWNKFVASSPQGAAFHHYDFLSLIIPNWHAIIIEEEGKWLAVMPFLLKKKWGFTAIGQPLFTQFSGILLGEIAAKNTYKQLSKLKTIVSSIVALLPETHKFLIRFSPYFLYPQPFYWKGYTLKTRFTYQLDLAESEDILWDNMAESLQRQIKKATKFGLKWKESYDKQIWFDLMEKNLIAGKNIMGVVPSKNHQEQILLEQVFDFFIKEKIGKLYLIENAENQVLACGFFVFWGNNFTYFAGAMLPNSEKSGAMSLLMWRAIVEAKKNNFKIFDFEGSMIEGIERFFRNFGAKPVPYFEISRNRLPILLQWLTKSSI